MAVCGKANVVLGLHASCMHVDVACSYSGWLNRNDLHIVINVSDIDSNTEAAPSCHHRQRQLVSYLCCQHECSCCQRECSCCQHECSCCQRECSSCLLNGKRSPNSVSLNSRHMYYNAFEVITIYKFVLWDNVIYSLIEIDNW